MLQVNVTRNILNLEFSTELNIVINFSHFSCWRNSRSSDVDYHQESHEASSDKSPNKTTNDKQSDGSWGRGWDPVKPVKVPKWFFTDRSKAVLLLWFIFICYHNMYNVCLLHDFVATLRLSALPSALYFVLSKLALWPPHFNSCSPCFP